MERPITKSTRDPRFSLSKLDRCRWNVVDLVTLVARLAVPTVLIAEIDMTKVESLRAAMKQRGKRITVTAFLLKAIALAQRAHPGSRSVALPDGRVVAVDEIVAGFTVERMVNGKPSVFIGTIGAPDQKPLEVIAEELDSYALDPISEVPVLRTQQQFSEMPWLVRQIILHLALRWPWLRLRIMPATFGVSSLGKFGVKCVTGPCASTSTFGVGVVEERAVVQDGQIVIQTMMSLSLASDLRVWDVQQAATFLKDIQQLLEAGFEKDLSLPILDKKSVLSAV